jgi:hypothetical protein
MRLRTAASVAARTNALALRLNTRSVSGEAVPEHDDGSSAG